MYRAHMPGGKWLVQALLHAGGVEIAPWVVESAHDGTLCAHVLDREEAATLFVNGCVAMCVSTKALTLVEEAIRGSVSAKDIIQRTDTVLKRHSQYSTVGAGNVVGLLVPFDGSQVRLI